MSSKNVQQTAKHTDWKSLREWVELRFMSTAARHGYSVSHPYGDSDRYDVAIERDGRFLRVQVKSTASIHRDKKGYMCQAHGSRYDRASYTAKEIDLLAVYIIPMETWYLFPPSVFSKHAYIYLRPDLKDGRYEPYREAWHLLEELVTHKGQSRCKDCVYAPKYVGDIQAVAEVWPEVVM